MHALFHPRAFLGALLAGVASTLAASLDWVVALAAGAVGWVLARDRTAALPLLSSSSGPPPLPLLRLAGWLARAVTALEGAILPGEAVIARRLAASLTAAVDAALVDLGVPPALCEDGGRGQAAPALAARLGCDPTALFRLLRAGAATGVVRVVSAPGGDSADDEAASVRFGPTSLTVALAAGPAAAVAAVYARHLGAAYSRLADAARRGTDAYSLAHGGVPFWTRVEEVGDGATFSSAMAAAEGLISPALLASARPWGGTREIVDVGGAHGTLLARLLDLAGPDARGTLFDTPAVVEAARAAWRAAGRGSLQAAALASGRVAFQGGDFFKASTLPVLRPGALAVARFILHDWCDADAAAILAGLRSRVVVEDEKVGGRQRGTAAGGSAAAAPPPPSLCLIELVLPPGAAPPPHPALALSDVNMLAAVRGGRERTASEWAALLARGGWNLTSIRPVGTVFLLEAATAEVGGAAEE